MPKLSEKPLTGFENTCNHKITELIIEDMKENCVYYADFCGKCNPERTW